MWEIGRFAQYLPAKLSSNNKLVTVSSSTPLHSSIRAKLIFKERVKRNPEGSTSMIWSIYTSAWKRGQGFDYMNVATIWICPLQPLWAESRAALQPETMSLALFSFFHISHASHSLQLYWLPWKIRNMQPSHMPGNKSPRVLNEMQMKQLNFVLNMEQNVFCTEIEIKLWLCPFCLTSWLFYIPLLSLVQKATSHTWKWVNIKAIINIKRFTVTQSA